MGITFGVSGNPIMGVLGAGAGAGLGFTGSSVPTINGLRGRSIGFSGNAGPISGEVTTSNSGTTGTVNFGDGTGVGVSGVVGNTARLYRLPAARVNIRAVSELRQLGRVQNAAKHHSDPDSTGICAFSHQWARSRLRSKSLA